jgi:hypothetical protein
LTAVEVKNRPGHEASANATEQSLGPGETFRLRSNERYPEKAPVYEVITVYGFDFPVTNPAFRSFVRLADPLLP